MINSPSRHCKSCGKECSGFRCRECFRKGHASSPTMRTAQRRAHIRQKQILHINIMEARV